MDVTRTMTAISTEALTESQNFWCLRLIHHPERKPIGTRYVFQPGQSIQIGRGGKFAGRSVLSVPSLSRNHVELKATPDGLSVRDLGSRNGTFVDGKRITETVAHVGQSIGVGSLLFLVHQGPMLCEEAKNKRFVGCSWQVAPILADIRLVSERDTTVTILGETGSGKEILAREIHLLSQRRGELVAINCGAISEGVLQSELFGHVRGAFSGAGAQRPGLIRKAETGTLFLDEIGDAPAPMQVTLLRLLQERIYRAVGSDQERTTSARFVTATAPRIREAVANREFREDLWMRLSRWVIDVPPLRERPDDIHVLAAFFAETYGGQDARLTPQFLADLCRHSWPGNVRELEGVIEAATVRARGDAWIDGAGWTGPQHTPRPEVRPTQAMHSSIDESSATTPAPVLPSHSRSKRPRNADDLVTLLKAHGGNVSSAARAAGVGRSTMYRWLEKYGVDPDAVMNE